MKSSEDLVF